MKAVILGLASLGLASAVPGHQQQQHHQQPGPIRRGCQVPDDGVIPDPAAAAAAAGKTARRQAYPSNFTVDVNFHLASTEAEADLITDAVVDAQWAVLRDAFARYDIDLRLNSTERVVDNVTGSAFLVYGGPEAGWVSYQAEYDAYLRATRRGGYDALNLYFFTSYSPGATGYCRFPTAVADPDDRPAFYDDSCQLSAKTMPGFAADQGGGGFEDWNLGHMAVHEAGHWFGLNHTFAGGCSDTKPGDFVADTPAQRWDVYGCPADSDTCPDQPGLDPIHNFMGYTADTCESSAEPGPKVKQQPRMLSYLAAVGAVWVIKRIMRMLFFAPQVIDNRLNPVHLAIGICGYRVQTELLGIPEQYGFFSSGPPRLQVSQGNMFPAFIALSAFPVVAPLVAILFFGTKNKEFWPIMGMVAISIGTGGFLWWLECTDFRRAPGYEWDDWKIHKD
ncbi:Extracellular metalloprotease [Colletotrichum tanaceti]|uniref:Extracellular metalloprotease n=1 Tax=Colletotrichum tanaceti TaxID=1306861 RepID=A0A4U6X407_9PEZI|nr:Extracellular metalloprotease [Colletotrichum tanaceti]TKW50101.1 Extracellular metalloprotease [Colletotrichum tanaceti]